MSRVFTGTLAAVLASSTLIALPAPASATIIIDTNGLATAENVLFNQSAAIAPTQVAQTNQTHIDVTFANALGLIADASGQSSVYNNTADGGYLVGVTTFGVGSGFYFTGAEFNVPGIPGNPPPAEATSVLVEALNSVGTVLGSNTISLGGNGENRIRVFGNNNEQLSKVRLTFNPTDGGVNALTQVRMGGATALISAVPEPATWMMMMLGFGMIGFAARRRTRQTVSVAYT